MIKREGRKDSGPGIETMCADMLLPVPVPKAGRQQVQGRGLRRNQISGFSEIHPEWAENKWAASLGLVWPVLTPQS